MKSSRGFTLIELIIVVTVLGIILAIAVPTFFEQLAKSRRAEAKTGLSDLQLRQEKWRSNHATYGTGAEVVLPSSTYYDFAVTAGSNTGTDVVMTATPKAAGPQDGDRCGTYTLRIDNDNNNAPVGQLDKTVSTAATDCW